MKTTTRLLLALVGIAFLATACSKSDSGDPHKKSAPTRAVHVRTAPHGGTLIGIGDHAYNLELLRDPATGNLTAWVLDGRAENFVRIAAPTLELVAMPGGKFTPLTLKAVANSSTGEKIGDTSQFEVQADWLRTAGDFSGIFTLVIKGTKFEQVSYRLQQYSPLPPHRRQLG
jgi:hypothetical protein